MSTPARKRLMRDFKRLQQDPPAGISGAPYDNNIMLWNAVIFGYHSGLNDSIVLYDVLPFYLCASVSCFFGVQSWWHSLGWRWANCCSVTIFFYLKHIFDSLFHHIDALLFAALLCYFCVPFKWLNCALRPLTMWMKCLVSCVGINHYHLSNVYALCFWCWDALFPIFPQRRFIGFCVLCCMTIIVPAIIIFKILVCHY